MAKPIPTYTALGESPTPRPAAGVARIDTGGLDAALHADAALIKAGTHLVAGAADLATAQDRFDTTVAEDAFNKLRDRQTDLAVGENGFATKKGADAVTQPLLKDYSGQFTQAQKEISDGLQNDQQRQKFNQRADVATVQFKQEILKHVMTENTVYGKQVLDGTIKTAVRNAQVSWDDPYAVATERDRIDMGIDNLTKQLGWPKEEADATRQAALTQLTTAVISSAVSNGNIEYAEDYYKAHREDMDLATQHSLLGEIKKGEQRTLVNGYQGDFLLMRDSVKGLDELDAQVNADEKLDEANRNLLTGRIASRRDILERRALIEQTRIDRSVKKAIDAVNANTLQGFEPSVEQLQPILAAAKGTDMEGEAAEMVAVANATRRFRLATPVQQENYLSQMEAKVREDPTKFDIRVVQRLRSIYDAQQKQIQDDPISFAARQGFTDVQPLDLSKPADQEDELAARAATARGMQAQYQAPLKILTKEEKDTLVGVLKNTPTAGKRDYFSSLAAATGEDTEAYSAIMAQLAPDDPVTAIAGIYAGRGLKDDKGTQVADLILRGQAILHPNRKEDGTPDKGHLWPMPQGQDEKTMHQLFTDYERDAFAGHPQARSDHYQTALAIYAAKSTEAGDASGVIDSTRWKDSIKLATGGIERYRGKSVVLPWGLEYGDFKDGVTARINEVALEGRLAQGVTTGKLQDLPLENIGDGKYVFRAGDGILVGKDRAPIVIDFNKPVQPEDARRGELGVLDRPGGGVSTELSVTVRDPRLNGGRPTNIPLLVQGQEDVPDLLADKEPTASQREIAIRRAEMRMRRGASLPSYETIGEAVKAAKARTEDEKMTPYNR